MRKGHLYVLISSLMLLSAAAVASEAESAAADTRTLEQKKERAYELRYVTKPEERRELLKLVAEIGPEAFFERYYDDTEEVLKVFKQLLTMGSSTTEESMARADLAAYLLKDKRAEVRSEALEQITRFHLYAEKLFVADTLYDMYKAAADNEQLRVRVAKALVLVGSNDMENKAPRKLGEQDYDENLVRFKEVLGDKSPDVRRTVLENLLPTYGTLTKLEIGAIEADPDPGVRAALIDYYRLAKIKTPSVCAMVLKALGSDDLGELDKAITFCKAMKLYEARESMFAALKRHAEKQGDQKHAEKLRALKLRMIDIAGELQWKDSLPDLVWIYRNDTDVAVQARAAYVILSLSGTPNVLLGTIEEPFPANPVEPETKTLLMAFNAWLISVYDGQGETDEVKRLREDAQIEFSDAVYDIAKARILDTDFANKRRGLKLVMDIGPEEFAKEVDAQQFLELTQSVKELWQRYGRTERDASRHIARMALAFTGRKDNDLRMNAVGMLVALASFCDKDVFIDILTPLAQDADTDFSKMVVRAIDAISRGGYSGREEAEMERRRQEREKTRSGGQ